MATLPNLTTAPSLAVILLALVMYAMQHVMTATVDDPLQRADLTAHGALSRVLVSLVSVGHGCSAGVP